MFICIQSFKFASLPRWQSPDCPSPDGVIPHESDIELHPTQHNQAYVLYMKVRV